MQQRSRNLQFFCGMVKKIHSNYPALFDLPDPQDEEEQGEGEGTQEGTGNPLKSFGIIPFILTYCQITNETFTSALRESVIQVLYIYSYEHTRKVMDEENRKRYMNANGFSGLR